MEIILKTLILKCLTHFYSSMLTTTPRQMDFPLGQ